MEKEYQLIQAEELIEISLKQTENGTHYEENRLHYQIVLDRINIIIKTTKK